MFYTFMLLKIIKNSINNLKGLLFIDDQSFSHIDTIWKAYFTRLLFRKDFSQNFSTEKIFQKSLNRQEIFPFPIKDHTYFSVNVGHFKGLVSILDLLLGISQKESSAHRRSLEKTFVWRRLLEDLRFIKTEKTFSKIDYLKEFLILNYLVIKTGIRALFSWKIILDHVAQQ